MEHRRAIALRALHRERALVRAGGGDSRSLAYLEKILGRHAGHAAALLASDDGDHAVEFLSAALDRSAKVLGEAHRDTAEIRAYLAHAYAARGDRARALRAFREATAHLLSSPPSLDGEGTRPRASDQRLAGILASYISTRSTTSWPT